MAKVKILALAGSARKDSLNKKLARHLAGLAEAAGAEVTFIDLRDYPMPIYDGDLEAESGLPEKALALKALFKAHDGLIITSPEYNSSFSALLKNSIDWVSRKSEEGEAPLSALRGKTAAIAAVSGGAIGGLRGLVPLRMFLGNIGVHVMPGQVAVGNGGSAFDDQGNFVAEANAAALKTLITQLVTVTTALKS